MIQHPPDKSTGAPLLEDDEASARDRAVTRDDVTTLRPGVTLHPDPVDDGVRCLATVKTTGKQCGSRRLRDHVLPVCSGHAGLGIAADPKRYGSAGMRAKMQTAEERRAAERLRRQGIASALRVRVSEHRDAMLDALMAPVLDGSLSPLQRQRAALEVWQRAFGRPGTADHVADGQDVSEMSLEQLADLWSRLPRGHDVTLGDEPPS